MPMMNTMRERNVIAIGLVTAAIAALGATTAFAAVPTAVTGGATSVTMTSARLYGAVNPNAIETLWAFQYGTSIRYGSLTTAQVIPGSHGSVAVSAKLSGLKPGTMYHFRLVTGQGSYPTVYSTGADQRFTTLASSGTGKRRSRITAGRGSLRTRRLTVHRGVVSIPLGCSHGAVCAGKLTLTASAKHGRSIGNVACASTSFSIRARAPRALKTSVGKRCLALLGSSRTHQIGAKLTASFSGGQGPLRTPVTLALG
jgi:hypothetical protein